MDQDSEAIVCKECKESYPIKTMVKHVSFDKKCKGAYDQDELDHIRQRLQQHSAAQKRMREAERYKKKKEQGSLESPKERAERYRRNKSTSSQYYQRNKVEISERYHKNSQNISEKYDSFKRGNDYQKKKQDLVQKRKDLKAMKNSEAGKFFTKKSYKTIYDNVIDEILYNHFDKADDIVNQNHESMFDEAMNNMFEKELWLGDVLQSQSREYSCCKNTSSLADIEQPCINCLPYSELCEIIESQMKKSLQKETDELKKKAVTRMMDREWDQAIHSKYLVNGMFSHTLEQIEKRCLNKFFTTMFQQKYVHVYNKAHDQAMDHVMLSELAWKYLMYEKDSKEAVDYDENMIDAFDTAFDAEMNKLGVDLWADVAKMIQDDFKTTVGKKFSFFKEKIEEKMRKCNEKRNKWACGKIEWFQKKLEEKLSEADSRAIIETAQSEIKQIYNSYEIDVKNAYKNCSEIEARYFCFSKVIDNYPKLDFQNDNKELEDNYTISIGKLEKELNIPKEKEDPSEVCEEITSTFHDNSESNSTSDSNAVADEDDYD